MIVLKANIEQFNALNGYENFIFKLEFFLDNNGNYIIGIGVLTDPNFLEIREQLQQLEQIEYTPYDSE